MTKMHLRIQNHQVIRKKAKEKVVAPIYRKNTLPKESIKAQEVTNASNLISHSGPPAPKK